MCRKKRCLYLHGAMASRMLRTLASGIDVCVTVTLVDGLVLARSAFHHSINYRSVVALGKAMANDRVLPGARRPSPARITRFTSPQRRLAAPKTRLVTPKRLATPRKRLGAPKK